MWGETRTWMGSERSEGKRYKCDIAGQADGGDMFACTRVKCAAGLPPKSFPLISSGVHGNRPSIHDLNRIDGRPFALTPQDDFQCSATECERALLKPSHLRCPPCRHIALDTHSIRRSGPRLQLGKFQPLKEKKSTSHRAADADPNPVENSKAQQHLRGETAYRTLNVVVEKNNAEAADRAVLVSSPNFPLFSVSDWNAANVPGKKKTVPCN